MTKDFTIEIFEELLRELKSSGYIFLTFKDYLKTKYISKCVIVRHDIDAQKKRALRFAEMENQLGISASYYFRIFPCSFDSKIIMKIKELGHEIGYHYEDLSLSNGDYEKAIKLFQINLAKFKEITAVETICMHGRAISKYDNRTLWKKYDYKEYGIIGEPYFDIDFKKVLYLTDTGQSWSGYKYNIRDKVVSNFKLSFKTTYDIIKNIPSLPSEIMITTHPDRWAFSNLEWYVINAHMKSRDVIKRIIFMRKSSNILLKNE